MLYQHSIYAEEAERLAQTERLLRRMIELYPDDPDGWNALGYILTDHNLRLDEAQELILRALSIRPDDPNILDSMGLVALSSGQFRGRAQIFSGGGDSLKRP